jgi:hypothetical protein
MITLYKKANYCIVSAGSLEDLSEEVQELLDEGWTCSGGVAPGVDEAQGVFIQALFK